MAGSDDNRAPGGSPPRNPQAAMVPAPEFLSLTFTLPYHLIQQVSDLAQDTNRSQSEIIAESIRLYMKAWATRQERTRISTFEGFTYQEVAIADATVEDAPRQHPQGAGEIPQRAEPEPAEPQNLPEDDAPGAQAEAKAEPEVPVPAAETAPEPDSDTTAREAAPEAEAEADAGDDEATESIESEAAEVDGDDAAETAADETAEVDEDETAAAPDAGGDETGDEASRQDEDASEVLQITDPASDVRARLQEIASEALDSKKLRTELEHIMYEVDMKDFSPPEHSIKVARMARELAEAKGLRGRQLLHVFIAGLVHDIGKACVPDEIIKKPRPSTDEMALIRKYPEFGLDLLSAIDCMEPVTAIVAAHQERWNGSGYPMGLARDDIPMEAQIVALCDVYDVLLTERRYRPAYGEDRARQIIEQNVGTLWNPDVANVFLKKILDPQAAGSTSRS